MPLKTEFIKYKIRKLKHNKKTNKLQKEYCLENTCNTDR